ncbi:MAG: hypothetical protein SX243_00300 [Acidobacteriota bacterium]|nr:hypothetical protein [Acidobacteriota bacterium]
MIRNPSPWLSRRRGADLLLGALLLASLAGLPVAAEAPERYLEKIADTPDLMQTDPRAEIAFGGGRYHCGPVSVSNALVWLGRNGYEKLLPEPIEDWADQGALVEALASEDYLRTSTHGTNESNFLRGVERYVEDHGYTIESLQYRGWTYHPEEYSGGSKRVDLDWLREQVVGASAVWLQIGWYRYEPATNSFRRFEAHWAALVGYEPLAQASVSTTDDSPFGGPAADLVLVVHDSAPRSGPTPHSDRTTLHPLESGTLVGVKRGLPVPASEYYRLGGELKIKEEADIGVLDGVVALRMGPSP